MPSAKPIHSMIRVRDEQKTVTFYKKAFGLEVADRYPKDDFTIMYLKSPMSPFELELTVNGDREKPYDIGDGYGHLAVLVDDLDAEHQRMKHEGLKPGDLKDIELGSKARFFFVEDPDGYKIEVIGRGGRFQDQ
jgi:lactoylglutathione lyase